MFERVKQSWRFRLLRHRVKDRAGRAYLAWCYFTDCLSADAAQRVMFDCEEPAGRHPLLTLTVESTLAEAREIFADHPDLPSLIAEGCADVADGWDAGIDYLSMARCSAIELAEEYATRDGITLVRLDGGDAAPDRECIDAVTEGGAP